MRKLFYFFLALICFGNLVVPVYAAPIPDIQSNSKTFDFTTGEWILSGNVIAQTANWKATADYVRVHPINLNVQASGNVKLSTKGLIIQADRVSYNNNRQIADISGNILISYGAINASASQGTYHMQNKTADLFGSVTLHPTSGGYIRSESAHFTFYDRKVIFDHSVKFELYKKHSGNGISGTALSGHYFLTSEQAIFSSATYHPIPSGNNTSVDTLTYSSQ